MDPVTITLVAAAAAICAAPAIKAATKRSQGDGDTLADLAVVARLGQRMKDQGNIAAVRAANALIEAVLVVPQPEEHQRVEL